MAYTFEAQGDQTIIYRAEDDSARAVAIVPFYDGEALEDHWRAVREFTAAPAMLAALEAGEGYLANHAEKGDPAATGLAAMFRAAIAKARGTPTGEPAHPIPAGHDPNCSGRILHDAGTEFERTTRCDCDGEPIPAYRSQWVSAIIRKSWEPRLSVFPTQEELRADLLEYARDTLEIKGLLETTPISDLADFIGEEAGDQVYWGEA